MESNHVFKYSKPTGPEVPILLSVPHCGTHIPDELRGQYIPEKIKFMDDTDWFVDKLYGFAPAMGIGMVAAHTSRWVIDLNRHPKSEPLYSDGRVITGLCPVTDFLGNSIYADQRVSVAASDIAQRVETFYTPYHQAIANKLAELKAKFGVALLWDCHSIRQYVPAIHPEKFPDLILGDADGTSASPGVIELTLKMLEQSGRGVRHNHPFKGGHITRHFGMPSQNIHALQLEMTKVNYMNDVETEYHPERAAATQQILKQVFEKLIDTFFHG